MQHITALVFNNFETLDLFGPVEMLGSLKANYSFQFCSMDGGLINSVHGVPLATIAVADLPNPTDILLIVGGFGTRQLIEDNQFLNTLRELANEAE